jgi:hypothetical protein
LAGGFSGALRYSYGSSREFSVEYGMVSNQKWSHVAHRQQRMRSPRKVTDTASGDWHAVHAGVGRRSAARRSGLGVHLTTRDRGV